MVYSDQFRDEAIRKFVEIGSYWKAAKVVGVSIATLHRWVRQREQAELEALEKSRKLEEGVDAGVDQATLVA